MKVFIASLYHVSTYVGGNEVYGDTLARELTARNHEVCYVCCFGKHRKSIPYTLRVIKSLWAWRRVLRGFQPDIVHACGSGIPLTLMAFYCRCVGVPSVSTFQAPLANRTVMQKKNVISEWLDARLFDRIIATQPQNAAYLSRYGKAEKVRTVWLSLKRNFAAQPRLPRQSAQQQLGLRMDIHYVFMTARLDKHHYYKGVEVALKAMRNLPSDYHLIIGGSGEMKPAYQKLAKEIGVDKRVRFEGNIADATLPLYYRAAKVHIMPSTSASEGFGLVLLESMASKTPTITTQVVGLKHVLIQKKVAGVVKASDPIALAKAIKGTVIKPDKEQIERAFHFVKALTPARMTEETLAVYREMYRPHTRVLFLNENPLPSLYTQGTVSGKELRLRAAIDEIEEIHAVALPGRPVEGHDRRQGKLEKKIHVHLTCPWPFYLSPIVLLGYGLYYAWKIRPRTIEAESPLLSGVAAVIVGKLWRIPVIVELRASYEELIRYRFIWLPYEWKLALVRKTTQWVYAHSAAIIVNSKQYQQQLQIQGFESTAINPGLQYLPKTYTAKHQQNIICYLGRLVEEKGVADLLQATAQLRDVLAKKKWRVWIVGEGKQQATLFRLAQELNIKQLVSFRGYQSNYQTLAKVKIAVNPCKVKHPLEMVNAEAAWSGVPVVCYGNASLPETVIDAKTGIKVNFEDSDGLARAIKRLLLDQALRQRLGQAGHKFAAQRYAFPVQVGRLRQVYSQLRVLSQ